MTSKRGKAARRAYREGLRLLSEEELQNLKCELGRELQAAREELNGINVQLDAIKSEQRMRNTITPAGFHISDHAIVRYLERHGGIDVEAVRAEIGKIAARAKRERRGVKHDAESGLTIGQCETTQNVTTVYRPRELAVGIGTGE